MKFLFIALLAGVGFTAVAQPTQNDIWINEFHYDGLTTYGQSDVNEFVEIVAKSSIVSNAAELARYKLVLFTAGAIDPNTTGLAKGVPYNVSSSWYSLGETEYPLAGFDACPQTVSGYSIFSKAMPILQDIPTGLALIYDNTTLVQFLSYEKTFTTVNNTTVAGAAAGKTTTLIANALGVAAQENALTTTTHSVSLTGSGSQYSSFTWSDAVTQMATPCAQNDNQTITSVVLPVRWLGFTATGGEDGMKGKGIVASEEKTTGYELQLQNRDGSFITKTTVAKDPAKKGTYTFELPQMAAGTYFIRVKSVDADGSVLYSETRRVAVGSSKGTLVLYPNPVKGQTALLQFTPSEKGVYQASIVDGTGRTVRQQTLSNLQIGQSNTITLQVGGLPTGIYRLKVSGAADQFTTTLHIMQ